MLPGFLTTALEIIIILDVCGAIAYFTISGFTRMKNKKETPLTPLANSPMPALVAEGPALESFGKMPERISPSVYHPNAPESPPQSQRQWTAGLKQRISTLTRKFTYRPAPGGNSVETRALDTDYAKLGRVLDSFKEET